MKKKTIVYLKNKNDASSYYRLYQFLKNNDNCRFIDETSSAIYKWYYNGNGKALNFKRIIMGFESVLKVTMSILLDMILWKSKIIIVNRKLFARRLPFYGKLLLKYYLKNKIIFWDFDDNIIYDGEVTKSEAIILQKYSKSISVTNNILKESLDKEYHNKVLLLSTTDNSFLNWEMDNITRMRLRSFNNKIRLVWIGTKNNLKYLESILPQLEDCSEECEQVLNKTVELVIVSNKSIEICTKHIKIINLSWNREGALNELVNAHIGLMPLTEDAYTIGKGGFKAVQYLGAGLPALVSDVGFNSQVITPSCGFLIKEEKQWKESILLLAGQDMIWEEYSYESRKRWLEFFHPDYHKNYWFCNCESRKNE